MVKLAIVGLPNVGKSSLFKILTNKDISINNYDFCTINPNIAKSSIIDPRLEILQKKYNSKEIIYTEITWFDIAGLIKGAALNKGLGNKFLSNIGETNGICHVLRMFKSEDVKRTYTENLKKDFLNIIAELILHDYAIIEKNIRLLKKQPKNKELLNLLLKIREKLEINIMISNINLKKEELVAIKPYNFLSLKPMILLLNISENQLNTWRSNEEFLVLKKELEKYSNISYYALSLKLIETYLTSNQEEKEIILNIYPGINEELNKFIKECFYLLKLGIFFTCGPKEIHSWSYKINSTIQKAAGRIHTDLENYFIMASVINYNELIKLPNVDNLKNNLKTKNKSYLIQDGDIINVFFKKN